MNSSRLRVGSREAVGDTEEQLDVNNAPTTPRWSHKENEEASALWDFGYNEDSQFATADASLQDDYDLPDSPWTIEAVDGEADLSDDAKISLPRPKTNPVAHSAPSSATSPNAEPSTDEVVYPRQSQPPAEDSKIDAPVLSSFLLERGSFQEAGPSKRLQELTSATASASASVSSQRRLSPKPVLATISHKSHSLKPPLTPPSHKTRSVRPSSEGKRELSSLKSNDRQSYNRKAYESLPHPRRKSSFSGSVPEMRKDVSRLESEGGFDVGAHSIPTIPHSRSLVHTTPDPSVVETEINTPNVGHFLLRGAQEGWTLMDDQATVEALQRLDGIGVRSAKSRFSVAGPSSSRVSSRPGTPASKSSATSPQWEGINFDGSQNHSRKRRGSSGSRDIPVPSGSEGNLARSTSSTNSSWASGNVRRSSVAYQQDYGGHSEYDDGILDVEHSGPSQNGERSIPNVPPLPPLPRRLSKRGVAELPRQTKSPAGPMTQLPEPFSVQPKALTPSETEKASADNTKSGRNIMDERVEVPNRKANPEGQPKTPSKKWSFSSALNLRISSSPHSLSPREAQRQSAAVSSRGSNPSSSAPRDSQEDALSPTSSLLSPSLSSTIRPDLTEPTISSLGPGVSMNPSNGPGSPSPTPQVKETLTHKRLTPSAIPFFRRSSSQSLHAVPPPSSPPPAIPSSPSKFPDELSTPGNRKSSVLSLLRGSSSRRSVQIEKMKDDTVKRRTIDHRTSDEGSQNTPTLHARDEKSKKEAKDRSESRISVLMGRRRGKTLSSAEKQKDASVEALPPMQMPLLSSSTAQRLSRMKSDRNTKSGAQSSSSSPSGPSGSVASSARLSSATLSSLAKQSDTSLRTRAGLPTIAGSPSVHGQGDIQTGGTLTSSILVKETPTKIPRKSGRSSANSPSILNRRQRLLSGSRRTSLNLDGVLDKDGSTNLEGGSTVKTMNEFGVLPASQSRTQRAQVTQPGSDVCLRSGSNLSSRTSSPGNATVGPASKGKRENSHPIELRKSSTTSTLTGGSRGLTRETMSSRFSALSPSKSLKFLSTKSSLSTARLSSNASHPASPSSSRQSLVAPSPTSSSGDDDEALADEEMLAWMKRQQTKAAGSSKKDELAHLLVVPDAFPSSAPVAPHEILGSSAEILTEYEKTEILEYNSIYYFGVNRHKRHTSSSSSANNHGYDDERGDYLSVVGEHLAYRYEVMDTLGKGSFGQVLRCKDHQTGESVAIKIIRNKKRFHHQALVEVKILNNLRDWDPDEKHYLIKMTDHFYFRNHLCIATELLSINLYELIKANGFAGFTTTLIRRFTSQLLASLSLMKHHRLVHCDLKPENVLLKHPAKSAIKVIDFGSSCLEHEKVYTYIQSRFYRSPEVILGMNYHMAIDMWSLGCILAELYTGFPIFPGENEQEQLSCIMEVLGPPEKELVNRSSRKRLFFDSTGAPRPVVNSKGRRRRPGTKTLAQVLRCDDELFIDFVAKCLMWDPERRLKPQSAMRHPFMTAFRRSKTAKTATPSRSSLPTGSSTGRGKLLSETPKKSTIGAPTPLSARLPRAPTTSVSATPISHSVSNGISSRLNRSSDSGGASFQSNASRTLSGYVTASAK